MALDRYLALRRRVRCRSVFKFYAIALAFIAGRLFIALVAASRIFSVKLRMTISNLFLPFSLMFSSYFCIKTYLSLS